MPKGKQLNACRLNFEELKTRRKFFATPLIRPSTKHEEGDPNLSFSDHFSASQKWFRRANMNRPMLRVFNLGQTCGGSALALNSGNLGALVRPRPVLVYLQRFPLGFL